MYTIIRVYKKRCGTRERKIERVVQLEERRENPGTMESVEKLSVTACRDI
jgi:hypothetical protein